MCRVHAIVLVYTVNTFQHSPAATPSSSSICSTLHSHAFHYVSELEGLRQLHCSTCNTVLYILKTENWFVTDEDLRGRNVLHVNYCPVTCLLKNQSHPLHIVHIYPCATVLYTVIKSSLQHTNCATRRNMHMLAINDLYQIQIACSWFKAMQLCCQLQYSVN